MLTKAAVAWLWILVVAAPAAADTPALPPPLIEPIAPADVLRRADEERADREEAPRFADRPLPGEQPLDNPRLDDESLLDDLTARTFRYFWETANPENGLIPDRFPKRTFSSIAAVGFALTVYPIGVERGYITRDEARERTLTTLRFFHDAPQGPEPQDVIGHKGFFYHFLNLDTGMRWGVSELSTVDTALFIAGALFAQSYFTGEDPDEAEIRELAENLYARIEWPWAQANAPGIALAWRPERGFSAHDWSGYNEAMIVYLLGLGAPQHSLEENAWDAWTRRYDDVWGSYYEQEYLLFSPGFGHQYTHIWVDFRGIRDAYMSARGLDYFENSRRAALAQHAYAEANPLGWQGYGEGVWGLTASDGPVDAVLAYEGEERRFRSYHARGIGYPPTHTKLGESFDDGTIAPTASVSSIVFTPRLSIRGIREMRARYGKHIYSDYGFLDAFNPSFRFEVDLRHGRVVPDFGWVADDYIGIDQGPIILMIENHRSNFVWEVMKNNPHIRRGLLRAGFRGGWLDEHALDTVQQEERKERRNGRPAGAVPVEPGAALTPARTPSVAQTLRRKSTSPFPFPETYARRVPSA